MIDFDELRRDRETGTQGPWSLTRSDPNEGVDCWWLEASRPFPPPARGFRVLDLGTVRGDHAEDARRIARVPQLEALALAAEGLAEAARQHADRVHSLDWSYDVQVAAHKKLRAAIAAYEAARGAKP